MSDDDGTRRPGRPAPRSGEYAASPTSSSSAEGSGLSEADARIVAEAAEYRRAQAERDAPASAGRGKKAGRSAAPQTLAEQMAEERKAARERQQAERRDAEKAAADARRAAEKAAAKGIRAMVGFSYRRVPAITFARDLVAQGAIGELRQVRALYLQDWLTDAEGPMTWRLDKEAAGSGALGDIGAHIVDAVQFITGERLDAVSGLLRTFVEERPLLAETRGLGGVASSERGQVTVDDAAYFTGKLAGGALASFEATRMATGRKNALRLEFSGSDGAISFDLERLNEIELYDATAPADRLGFRRILVTEPEHPYTAAWWPTGHGLGYEHAFTHQVRDLVHDIAAGREPQPSFADGLRVQRVLDAVERSSADGSAWKTVDPTAS